MNEQPLPPQDCEQQVKTLKHQLDWLLDQYKKLQTENEKLKDKVRAFYGH